MRGLLISVCLFVIAVSPALGGPRILTYQGSLLNPTGHPVVDGAYDMRFELYGNPAGGTAVWSETETSVPVQRGLFSTVLGDDSVPGSEFSSDFSLYLQVAIDLNRNHTFEAGEIYAPRQRIAGSAWAIEADRLQGHSASDFQRRVTGVAPAGQFLRAINEDGSVVAASVPVPLILDVASTGATAIQMTKPASIANLDNLSLSPNAPSGAISNVHYIGFRNTGTRLIDLNQGNIQGVSAVVANNYLLGTAPTFYRNYSFMEMVPVRDNWTDEVVRHYENGYAFVLTGGDVHVGTGVHLPQGATITEMRAVVYDDDASGDIQVDLYRFSRTGARVIMASRNTGEPFQSTSVQDLTVTTITSPNVDNESFTYALCVWFTPSEVGPSKIRFYSVRLAFTMPKIAP